MTSCRASALAPSVLQQLIENGSSKAELRSLSADALQLLPTPTRARGQHPPAPAAGPTPGQTPAEPQARTHNVPKGRDESSRSVPATRILSSGVRSALLGERSTSSLARLASAVRHPSKDNSLPSTAISLWPAELPEATCIPPYTGSGLRNFTVSASGPVGGSPVCHGELLMFDPDIQSMRPCTVLLFSSGFYAVARDSGAVCSHAWSPFAVLSKSPGAPSNESFAFALSNPAQGGSFHFATSGVDAESRCEHWLASLSDALFASRKTAFPPYAVAVEPLEAIPSTSKRILASYLLLRGPSSGTGGSVETSAPYCELHAHYQGFAKLVMYEDENCTRHFFTMQINGNVRLFEREGISCCSFSVDGRSFCARSPQERQLWIRALTNVKVKLQNNAPDPDSTELTMIRQAVLERIVHVELLEAAGRLGAVQSGVRRGAAAAVVAAAAAAAAAEFRGKAEAAAETSVHSAAAPQCMRVGGDTPAVTKRCDGDEGLSSEPEDCQDSDDECDKTKEHIVLESPMHEIVGKAWVVEEPVAEVASLSEMTSPQSTCSGSGMSSSHNIEDDLPPMEDDDETPSFGRGRRLGPSSSRPGPGLHRPPRRRSGSNEKSAKRGQRRPCSAALRRAAAVAIRTFEHDLIAL